jgi:pimeloyl-ACP methyl ester carboxylesterase
MTRIQQLSLLVGTAALLAAPVGTRSAAGEPEAREPARSGRVEANGVNYYYEIHGSGEPLLLLHGGLGSFDMFAPLLPLLAEHRQVIGVDMHGHGRTPLGPRPIRLVDMGDDMAVILRELGYGEVDALGYSLGAGVALRLAVQHPAAVRRLVLVSGAFAQSGYYPEILAQQHRLGAGMAEAMKETPMYRSYAALAPQPEDFPRLLESLGEWMRMPFDWSADVKALEPPVLLIYGDSDLFRLEHIAQFYQLLGGGQRDAGWQRESMPLNRLAILPDLTHYEIFMAPALLRTALPFLDGVSGARSWAEELGQETR